MTARVLTPPNPRLCQIADGVFVNPRHVAFTEPVPGGGLRVHMSAAQTGSDGKPGHAVLDLSADEASRLDFHLLMGL